MASAARLQEGLEAMTHRVVDTAGRVGEGFPHYGDAATGEWTTSPGGDWTLHSEGEAELAIRTTLRYGATDTSAANA